MSARAPSLEIFEHLTASRRLGEAFSEARAILNAVNLRFGRIDALAWKASAACVSEHERLIEFATRFCAAIGQLVTEREFDPGLDEFTAYCGLRRWLDTMFRVSAFGSSDHLLEPIARGENGAPWAFEGSATKRFLLVWSPESGFRINPAEWLEGFAAFAGPAFLGHLGARACLTPGATAWREALLDLMPAHGEAWRLDRISADWIVEPYLHCSYANSPGKHAIKAKLVADLCRVCLDAGCVEVAPGVPRPRRDRPVMLVTAESFADGHSVHRTHSRAVRGLREFFHVVGMINPAQRSPHVDDCFDDILDMPGGGLLDGARAASQAIVARSPDIVLHLGVGLSPRVIALASLRLAPIQCASYGHAATTMSPAIDYFALPREFVGDAAAFSERLPDLTMDAFPYEARAQTPLNAGPPDDGAVHIAVPASLPKISSFLLDALAEVSARATRRVVFEFFPLGAAGLAHLDLMLALARRIPDAIAHPEMEHDGYMAALARCDFFLSPFPYGNMNSIADAMAAGLPGICLDGREPHAHADVAIFARLGLPKGWAARDVEGYVAAALLFVEDAEALAQAREQVAGVYWRARLGAGDEGGLGRALQALLRASN